MPCGPWPAISKINITDENSGRCDLRHSRARPIVVCGSGLARTNTHLAQRVSVRMGWAKSGMRMIKSGAQRKRMEPYRKRSATPSCATVYNFNARRRRNLVSRRIQELEDENGKLSRLAARATIEVTALRAKLRGHN